MTYPKEISPGYILKDYIYIPNYGAFALIEAKGYTCWRYRDGTNITIDRAEHKHKNMKDFVIYILHELYL